MASVNSSGNATVGEMLTLTCSITRTGNETGSVLLQWIGPDGSQMVSMGAVVVGSPITSGATTSLSLQFTTLFTSHGGEYACQGVLTTQDSVYTIAALQDVIVQGNCSFDACMSKFLTLVTEGLIGSVGRATINANAFSYETLVDLWYP